MKKYVCNFNIFHNGIFIRIHRMIRWKMGHFMTLRFISNGENVTKLQKYLCDGVDHYKKNDNKAGEYQNF